MDTKTRKANALEAARKREARLAEHYSSFGFICADGKMVQTINSQGHATVQQVPRAVAEREGLTLIEWPTDPAGPISSHRLVEHLPPPPPEVDPATAARAARLEAIANTPEAANVSADVLERLAERDMPIAEARGLLRGLSPRAISNQLRGKLDNEPMTEAATTTDDPRAARLRELRANVAPTKATANAAQLIAADTDPKRARLLEIKIGGVIARAERGDRAAIAKRREIESACNLARANNLPLIHALAVAGVTL